MIQFDPTTGALSLPLWVTATVAAVVLVLGVLALVRNGALKTIGALLAIIVVGYGGWMSWVLYQRADANDRTDERRVFDQRASEILAHAMVPGSPLSCLDGMAGDQVDTACEKLVFGTPESIAAAVSYVAARLALLTDGIEYAGRADVASDITLASLRRGLEADRFGIVAYVLSQQDNCNATQCDGLIYLKDPNHVRLNLQDKPFDALVTRYAPTWPATRNTAAAPAAAEGPRAMPGGGTAAPISSKYDLPSSSSIPPVSIMSAEPASPPPTTASAPAPAQAPAAAPAAAPQPSAAASAAPPSPPRRPPAARVPAVRAPAPAPAPEQPAPVQLTPAPGRQSAE